MALQKTVTTVQGFSADYHRLDSVSVDIKAHTVTAEIITYKDAAAAADKTPCGHRFFTFDVTDQQIDNLRTFVYNKVKDAIAAQPGDPLEGAVDV